MANNWKLSGPIKDIVANLAQTASPSTVETDVLNAIADNFGANPTLELRKDGTVARTSVLTGSLVRVNDTLSVPQTIASQSTTVAAVAGGVKVARLIGQNGNVLTGTWGLSADNPGIIVPGDLTAGQELTHGAIVFGSSLVNSTANIASQTEFINAAKLWRDNAPPSATTTQGGVTLFNAYGRSRFPTYASLSAQMPLATWPPPSGQRLTGDGSGLENCDTQGTGEGRLLFPAGVDAVQAWHWFYAEAGHTATNTALAVADAFCVALRPDGVWQYVYSGGVGSGFVWDGNTNTFGGGGQNVGGRNPNWTVVKPAGNIGYELWAASSGKSQVSLVNGSLLRSALCVVVGCRVKPIIDNPSLPDDRANARYIGQLGFDWYNKGNQGAGRKRYDYYGYPLHAADAETTGKRLITDTGDWQWIVLSTYDPGLGNDFFVRNRPWVTDTQTYNSYTRAAGGYAITRAQFLANPPPVPGNLEA